MWRVVFCIMLLLPAARLHAQSPPPETYVVEILARMNAAYAGVEAYQAEVESSEYHRGRLEETRRFHYAYRKPGRVRIDMYTPHPGMRLTYPDAKGRVVIRFGGWLAFARLRLQPDNHLFATRSGQHIDQSDFGLLIRNIGRSMTKARPGSLRIEEQPGRLLVELVSADHFLAGVTTRYRFVIDKALWLPVAITESTPEGRLKRTISFKNLQINPVFSEHYFDTDEEDSADAL